jgi:hypothetical protein
MIMMSLDWVEGCSDSRTPEEHSRPIPLKHLPVIKDQVLTPYPRMRSEIIDGRSYWIPGSSAPTLTEEGNAFLRPLKNKGFEEDRVTTMR